MSQTEIVTLLTSLTIRSSCLAMTAWLVVVLFRLKTPAERHAMWMFVVISMLLLVVLTLLLPPISMPVPQVAEQWAGLAMRPTGGPLPGPIGPKLDIGQSGRLVVDQAHLKHAEAIICVYAIGALVLVVRLVLGYAFTLRLVRRSRPLGEFYESDWIVGPMTIGCVRPKILLPTDWRVWEPSRLRLVLEHEMAHIKRADWLVAAIAALNRCVYWFNPLAWLLERRLAVLAEQACDDSVLLATGAREQYARALLDITAVVAASHGRVKWKAMAMTKRSEVRSRIERILDERREIPAGMTRRRWLVLATCALFIVYFASAVQPAVAPTEKISHALRTNRMIDLRDGRLPPGEVTRLEGMIAGDPHNLEVRAQLITHYLVTGMNEPRAHHILWLLEHHPEADILQLPTLFNEPGPLQDRRAYERAAEQWRQQAVLHRENPKVILNAAYFFGYPTDDPNESEGWLKRARDLEPNNATWSRRLALLYAGAVLATSGAHGASTTEVTPHFAKHARKELASSTDGLMLWQAGQLLQASPGASNGRPELVALASFGKLLQKRAQNDLGHTPPAWVLRKVQHPN